MAHVAVPVASVFAVQGGLPLRVKVTGSFTTRRPVLESVRTAENVAERPGRWCSATAGS